MTSTFVFSMDFGFLCANMYLCIYMLFLCFPLALFHLFGFSSFDLFCTILFYHYSLDFSLFSRRNSKGSIFG